MLGMAFVAGQKQHISLTLLLDKVSPTIRGWWDIILQVIFIAFSIWVLIIGGLKISAISMLQISLRWAFRWEKFITRSPARAY